MGKSKTHKIVKAYDRAVESAQQALAVAEGITPPQHGLVVRSLNALASLHFAQRKFAETVRFLKREQVLLEKTHGHDHPKVARCQRNLKRTFRQRWTVDG